MKHSKSDVRCKFSRLPELRFDEQKLTSFSGLVIFQQLFAELSLRRRLSRCFTHRRVSPIFPTSTIVLILIISVILGYRRLRDVQYFKDDPLVLRILGIRSMPSTGTISRQLAGLDDRSVKGIERVQRTLVLERLATEKLSRITLDFDGSVLGTCRRAQGVAKGYNSKKKGQRSYYPLNCTVAQTAQVLAVMHRSGNVHDSNGAEQFIRECVEMVKNACPSALIETRMDGAFFSEKLIALLDELEVQYSISVPFERYLSIKSHIEDCQCWNRINCNTHHFDKSFCLDSWSIDPPRFIFVRRRNKLQSKGVVQLDMLLPYDFDYQYKAIVSNKTDSSSHVIKFHEGRGTQEGIFAKLKSQAAMDYVPCNSWNANKLFLLCNVMALNLTRELQMRHYEPDRRTSAKRPAMWTFNQMGTLRKRLIQRAGRLLRPQGVLTLSMAANDAIKEELLGYLPAYQ